MISFNNILLVLAGSGIGGVVRFIITQLVQQKTIGKFPYGTLLVNVLGCILIGMVVSMVAKQGEGAGNSRLLLATGFCGGFTTFSAFALENIELIKMGNYTTAFTYMFLSVVAGLMGTLAGLMILK